MTAMQIRSSAFADGVEIPSRFTCEGADISPPLSLSGVPEQAASLVLVVEDPDAPDPAAPKMTWVHWLLYNLPPDTGMLAEDVQSLPVGTGVGLNSWQRASYAGPCPPVGRHRYYFRLYALDIRLPDLAHPTRKMLLQVMAGHVLASVTLLGTYRKQG